ncbi:Maf family protein [Bradyrhizobium sp. U87765 SZCCT0131]|uniref:Maf family protein n=1 Tax=unclassified Bradyrhizobium TaxID=2631580 RepID=UPI001BABCFA1|nr:MULTISPECIES: Maf family protein [unclassified Bradyrhizobium]MBR1216815.1 Maf family protein [Bradyrhizobium sp. U87765 SZCCT0131]MBR1259429.1 Maf family protein [Bradyrhizobium sp. U87765 SZCCT0134]MBR1305570.1 Maf family protein [Bradyrhizobium sp. U87765 SZCCT0110]MBR1321937.1 Maf family protein [Bradyrhizobium sp. U87765 SZCCT0109]MBR1350785.1 Maf family protein [Bradyrhizobium sp. U87765 SZCCT0048]
MTLWRGDRPLILASQSRSRQALLQQAGLDCRAIPAEIDERAIQQASGLTSPGEIAELLASEKARAVAVSQPGHLVIGADQTLALGQRLFNKPAGRAEAFDQLQVLAGQTHELHSAVAVARDGEILFADVAVARMTMRPLGAAAISAYLDAAGDAVTTTVGAYQLEKLGVHLFARIEGDHFTILGLPLLPLLDFFRGEGVLAF